MLVDNPSLRGRLAVFRDRRDAGMRLTAMLQSLSFEPTCVIAVPAGGVDVGAVLADAAELPLSVAVVSPIAPPWASMVPFGAVSWDGTVSVEPDLVARLGLSGREIEQSVARAQLAVGRRVAHFGPEALPGDLTGRSVVLVDEALGAGVRLRAALESLRHHGAREVVVAVPTGRREVLRRFADVKIVLCPNVRGGLSFTDSAAFVRFTPCTDAEAAAHMNRLAASPTTAAAPSSESALPRHQHDDGAPVEAHHR